MPRTLFVFVLVLSFGLNAFGQSGSDSARTFEFPVSFSKNAVFPKVSLKDIEILEDGRQLPLLALTRSDEALSIGILIDLSGSVSDSPQRSKIRSEMLVALSELIRFIDSSNPNNEYFLTVIHKDVFVNSSSTLNSRQIKPLISDLSAKESKGNTPFFDSMASSLAGIASSTKKKVLIAITDGDDNTSTKNNFDDVSKLIRGEDVSIFALNFTEIPRTPRATQGEDNLKQFCDLSGGRYLGASDKASWSNWSKTIGDELTNRYFARVKLIATEGNPKWRKLKVRLTSDAKRALDDPQVRARKGIVF